jgi:hypothetical protein
VNPPPPGRQTLRRPGAKGGEPTTTPIPADHSEEATTPDHHTPSHGTDTTGDLPPDQGPEQAPDLRQRLVAIARERSTDTPAMAALRALLRDEAYTAGIIADVQHWPPLTTEQRETLTALLRPQQRHH